MKLLFLIEKLQASEVFQQYKEKNPSAFFFGGFFCLELDIKNNQYQLDYSDDSGNIMTFSVNSEIKAKPAEQLSKIPLRIKDELKIDIDALDAIAKKEAENKGLKINKIMAILQNVREDRFSEHPKVPNKTQGLFDHEGKVIWNLTCMQGLKILKLKISAESGEIFESSELNMMDFVKKIKKN